MSRTAADMERLRQILAEGSADALPTDACPPPEAIWRAARGMLENERAAAQLDHALTCGWCTKLWAGAREMASEEAPLAESRAKARSGWTLAPAWLAAAAALVVLAGAAVIWSSRFQDQEPMPVRSTPDEEIASLLPEGVPQSRESCRLFWTPVSGASYDVTLATRELKVIWSTRGLTEAEVIVPADALKDLPAASRLIWQVTARAGDGRVVRSRSIPLQLE